MTFERLGAGQRLADCLRRIREGRGVDLAEVIARTRAAPDIAAQFEVDCLIDHPTFSRVYVRPFARAYADVVGLDPERVLRAVDAAERGRYDDALAVEILGDEPEAEPFVEPEPEEISLEESPALPRMEPTLLSWKWPDFRKEWIEAQLRSPVVIVAGAVLFVLMILWAWPSGDSASTRQAMIPLEETDPVSGLPPRIVVGDVMRVWIIAVDTLNPVRVKVDDLPRAPYWIEKGDSMAFDVDAQIVLEREVDQLALSVSGRRIPTLGVDTTGRLVLTPERVQELLDSLRTAG